MARRSAFLALFALALAGCLPDLSGYEVRPVDEDGGMHQPGAQLPEAQDCSAPIPIGAGYREGFETGPNGWGVTADRGRPSWELGAPVDELFRGSPGGGNIVATGLGIFYPENEESYLVSPCFDASAATNDLLLSFSRVFNTERCCDRATIEVSVDGGETWTAVTGSTRLNWYSSGGFAGEGEWASAAALLPGTAGQPRVQLRVKWRADTSQQFEGFAIDDVELRASTTDLALTIEEADRCGYVDATITNLGGVAVTGYELLSNVDGVDDVQTFDSMLAYLQTREVMIGENLARSLTASVFTTGDVDAANNDVSFGFTAQPIGGGYFSDFEADGGMLEVVGEPTSWEIGAPMGELIRAAASGSRAWVTNLDGEYGRSERGALRLPCMDMSTLATDPMISLSRVFRTEGCCDYARIEVSVDGASFRTVGSTSSGGTNWYTERNGWGGSSGAGEWAPASHELTRTAGGEFVRVRVLFYSDGSQEFEGFGLDDLAITPMP